MAKTLEEIKEMTPLEAFKELIPSYATMTEEGKALYNKVHDELCRLEKRSNYGE